MDRSKWDIVFENRYRFYEDELKAIYFELYHNDLKAYEYFVGMLNRMFESRPAKLKDIDHQREMEPEWYKSHQMVGMQMYVNAFAGTLRGVQEKLDYIEECGVNYLHLMPLLESPEGRSDGGYAVSDFRKVQPELGTMEDLSALADKCHDKGMMLCLDFVMNHTSEDHEWAKKAKAGDRESQNRYFFYDTWEIPNAYERTVPQVFPTTAPGNFSWCSEAGKVVMTTFYPYQWDLNYANPTVINDMTENMLFLCNQGIDVIRLDAVPYIWKVLGTTCRNQPEVHKLVRLMRIACEIVCPGTLLLGEVVMEPSKVAPYFGTVEKPECHMLYNVTTMATIWHTVATRDVRLLAHQIGQIFALPREYTFLNYLRCHDDIGWGLDFDFLGSMGQDEVHHKKYLNDYFTGVWPGSPSRGELYNNDPKLGDARLCGTTASLCGIEAALKNCDHPALEAAMRLDEMLHALIFTLSGVPVLYSGDEVAQTNDNAYHSDPMKADDSRYIHRGNMDWQKAARSMQPNTVEGKIFASITGMESIRRRYDVFDAHADTWLLNTCNDHILGIGRYYNGEKLLALFNFDGNEQIAWPHDMTIYTDLMTGEKLNAGGVIVPPGSFKWLLHTFDKEQ